MPAELTTFTSTVPAFTLAGVVALIERSLTTTKLVAGMEPKFTAVALVKPTPLRVTEVPPAIEPLEGEMLITYGDKSSLDPSKESIWGVEVGIVVGAPK